MKLPVLFLLAVTLASAAAADEPAAAPKPPDAPGPQTLELNLEGTPRKIDIDEMPVARALEQLGTATGMTIAPAGLSPVANRAGGAPVQLHETKIALWPALTKLFDQAAGAERSFTWSMSPRSENTQMSFSGRYCASGAFLVVANRLERVADFQRRNEETEQFFLHLMVAAELGVHMVEVPQVVLPKDAQDVAGLSMRPAAATPGAATRPAFVERYARGEWWFNTAVQLTKPEKAGERIKIIKGAIPVGIVTRQQTLKLAPFGETSLTVEGVKITFTCRDARPSYQLVAQFAWDKNIDPEQRKALDGRLASSRFRVFDAAGNEYVVGNGGGGRGTNQRVVQGVVPRDVGPRKIGPPAEARLEVPLATQMVEIPFEFKDLPMP